jgi:hypothetical protein
MLAVWGFAGVNGGIIVRVIVGVIDLVIVVVGLAGGVQEGRGVVEGVILEGISLLKGGGKEVVLADGEASGVSGRLDMKRANVTTKIRIESARTPNMTGSAYRGVDEGDDMIVLAGFRMKFGEGRRGLMGWHLPGGASAEV